MNVREIVIAHLQSIGADGLCAEECGCGIDDFMPCGGDRDISTCKPANATPCDGSCSICGDGDENILCYRPMNTTTKEEDKP